MVIEDTSISVDHKHGIIFLRTIPQNLWFRDGQDCTSSWHQTLAMFKTFQFSTGFEGMTEPWRKLKLGTVKDQGRTLVKVQPKLQ